MLAPIRFRTLLLATPAVLLASCASTAGSGGSASLDLWNEGATKEAIVEFVADVTDESSSFYRAPEERVAVFDMDGTILLERPQYVLFDFAIRRMLATVEAHPELGEEQPYKAIVEGDWEYFGDDWYSDTGLYSVLLYASDGLDDAAYARAVEQYFASVTDERFGVSYDRLVFAPVVQLIDYLTAHDFEVWVCSGSNTEFIRILAPGAAHVPVDRTIGSTILTAWEDGRFVRQHAFVQPINDEAGKPVNIRNRIGRVPILAVGNSHGDLHMLEYSKQSGHSLQLIVNHDDAEREYRYKDEDMRALCAEYGWREVSMKDDFRILFAGLSE